MSHMYLTGFPLLILLLAFAGVMPFLLMTIAQIVQFKAPGKGKYTTYESGMEPFGDARIQFDVKFYMYALLFIVFDIETVFLFPWAITYGNLELDSMAFMGMLLVEMTIFIGILLVGLIYAFRRDALKWQ
ncbi:MAG: NADH-quinone oxidoreductase subunit A [Vampirovibrio sp.]|nr:NADH-quinone oxidoreductase subunit A [Vampirovibrio sp.]